MMCMKKSNGNEREKCVNNKHKYKYQRNNNMKSEIHMEYLTYSEVVFSFRIL